MLDEPAKMFTPKPRYAPKDNQKDLSSIGDTCFKCLQPINECEHESDS